MQRLVSFLIVQCAAGGTSVADLRRFSCIPVAYSVTWRGRSGPVPLPRARCVWECCHAHVGMCPVRLVLSFFESDASSRIVNC